jgi:CRISPR-associated protein Cas1
MGWRTIYITQKSKLSYKSSHLLIQTSNDVKQISLHQINCLMIATTQSVLTGYLVAKLVENNIKIIFCSEDHNPCAEICGYYNNLNQNKNIEQQISWAISDKESLWTKIISNKIDNQIAVLKINDLMYKDLIDEKNAMVENDESNREAVIARKYFSRPFGEDFSRGNPNNINAMLNYGYTILLSAVNQEISSFGYLTQLGVHHHSLFNDFNLSSDLMEPFRPFIDLKVIEKQEFEFDEYVKFELIDVLHQEIHYAGKNYILRNALSKHVHDCIEKLNGEDVQVNPVVIDNEV